MKNFPHSNCPPRQQGVALVLVLCFIVLVTGLVVAYFSRTLTTRQLSNASTSTTNAELLAASATDVIVGGLKQEIADPVASITPTPSPGVPTIYVPAQAKYAVPQRNASPAATPAVGPAPAVGPIPNLVRRSLRTDSASGGVNAVPTPAVSSLASAANSATSSANGRSVSPARWNRHYLIPTTAAAGSTISLTTSAPVTDFTAPDWVFVTGEKGPDVLSSPAKDTSGNAVTVTGRYAYAIYDEGGLLDINHTGYPSVSTLGHIGAKPAPSYADLTQLGMTAANVDNLLGWRHYATLQPAGAFPNLQPPSSSATDTTYYNLFASTHYNVFPGSSLIPISNGPSILQIPLTVWNNKTDQTFLSRQQLIDYFAAAGADSKSYIDPKYLQYLGTFSRSLNQPSYVPETNRPPVLKSANGGNNAGDDSSNRSTNITPNFLAARVLNAFNNPDLPASPNTRYDGTPVVIGEPLIKKRFPLNRLAWLTYGGPSATNRNTSATALTGPDADIGYLKQYGITKEWLDQGTPDNIKTYFGLVWAQNPNNPDGTPAGGYGWTYVHNNGGAILNINNPSKLTDVVRQSPGREPDFFELLKAAINPGSIAKTSLSPGVFSEALKYVHAAEDQYYLDDNLDRAILQIGANIIDQFDTDGYPTRINYNLGDSKAGTAVFGDENLPSISRVRSGLIHLAEANPVETLATVTDPVTGGLKPVIDTGVAALMNYPEIWNVHDWDASTAPPAGSSLSPLAQSVGAVGPTNFKIYAATNTNSLTFRQATVVSVWDPIQNDSSNADAMKSPGFVERHFQFGGETRTLAESNTKMTFVINPADPTSEALFREPTVLFTPGVPTNSQLASPTLVPGNVGTLNSPGLDDLASNPSFFSSSGGGLVSVVGASANGDNIPVAGQAYIGFYLGAHPLRFWTDAAKSKSGQNTNYPAFQTQFNPSYDVVFTLACQDATGAWIPYDTKELTTPGQPNASLQTSVDAGFGLNGAQTAAASAAASASGVGDLDYGLRYYQTIDPRTNRFGVLDPWIIHNTDSIPPRRGYSGSTDPGNRTLMGTLKTDREGVNSGTTMNLNHLDGNYFLGTMGWYGCGNGQTDVFRPGMLTQNNPYAHPDGLIAPPTPGLPSDYTGAPGAPIFYADADGVTRRASGGNVDVNGTTPASTTTGLPMAYASGLSAGSSSGPAAVQMDSRPSILNRPFRSVAELGYVYSGTPWKNLDFFLPESGDSALLDVFCVSDNSDGNALTAGQVNLNTHQVPVLQAILAQAAKDQWNDASVIPGGASAQAQQLAQLLVSRTVTSPKSGPNTGNGPQPLQNVSDLVGRWVKTAYLPTGGIDGKKSYDGFAQDLAAFLDAAATGDQPMHNIQRFGETAVRALSNAGQTRVWNLMFDIVAQTGRFGTQATTLDQFNVEGEQHYWVHVAIDRYTGQIVDKQVEVVKE